MKHMSKSLGRQCSEIQFSWRLVTDDCKSRKPAFLPFIFRSRESEEVSHIRSVPFPLSKFHSKWLTSCIRVGACQCKACKKLRESALRCQRLRYFEKRLPENSWSVGGQSQMDSKLDEVGKLINSFDPSKKVLIFVQFDKTEEKPKEALTANGIKLSDLARAKQELFPEPPPSSLRLVTLPRVIHIYVPEY
ncbi:hypothetical protein BDZ45DRAFT_748779 [Acephala macrosclerotiorum]|nr:hypothetical protein BDZ45DRAFT_748779 [Acephala macrosclerotiorum]